MWTSAQLSPHFGSWALAVALTAACGDGSGTSDGTSGATNTTANLTSGATNTTSDPSGGSATTDSPTGGSGETGSTPLSQEACERYLACVAVAAPASLPSAQQGFGENGTCWQGSAAEMQQCIDACQAGLEELHMASPDEPACALCQGNEDCEGGQTCMNGECRIGICGDGIVESDEICDDQVYCQDDCRGPSDCSPLNGAGCPEGSVCIFDPQFAACKPDSGDLPQGGEQCKVDTCGEGFGCFFLCFNEQQAPCCETLCNVDLEGEDCPAGQSCVSVRDVNVLGVEPSQDLAEYIGICM